MNPLPATFQSLISPYMPTWVYYICWILYSSKKPVDNKHFGQLPMTKKWFSYLTFCHILLKHCFRAQLHSALIKGSEEERRLFRKIIPPCLRWPYHVITLDQWEVSIQVAWSLSANQRQVSRSSYHSQPMRGLLTIAGWQRPNCIWVSRHRASGGGQLSGQSGSRISDELGRLPPYITQ